MVQLEVRGLADGAGGDPEHGIRVEMTGLTDT